MGAPSEKTEALLPQGYEFQSETLRKNVATTKAAAVVAVLEAREFRFRMSSGRAS
jgi:hypothetical protein